MTDGAALAIKHISSGRGDQLRRWQLIDTSTWAVHSLSVVPVIRFVGGSQPATGLTGQGSRPVDLPKYDQLAQIIGVREPWQLQYEERWEQLFVTCESSGRAPFSVARVGLPAGLRESWGQPWSPRPPQRPVSSGRGQSKPWGLPGQKHLLNAGGGGRKQEGLESVSRDGLVGFFFLTAVTLSAQRCWGMRASNPMGSNRGFRSRKTLELVVSAQFNQMDVPASLSYLWGLLSKSFFF